MRTGFLVGQTAVLGFRHFYNGVLADAYEIVEVKIYNPNGAVVHTVPGPSVVHVGIGAYSIEVPGTALPASGTYYDVWTIRPTLSSSVRTLTFSAQVTTQEIQAAADMDSALECSIDQLDACVLKNKYLWPIWGSLQNYVLYDSVLQSHIDSAISWAQSTLNLPLRQRRVATPPFAIGQGKIKGVDYDEEGSLLQYSHIESFDWGNIRLPHTEVTQISGLRGVWGGTVVYNIPLEWIDRNHFKNGFIRIRPTTTGLVNQLIDNSGIFLTNLFLESRGTTTVPGFWAADYTYGPKDGKISKEICDVIMKKASVLILDQVGMSISQGIASKSAAVDGMSSSVSLVISTERTMFSALAARYEADLTAENLMKIRQYNKRPFIAFF